MNSIRVRNLRSLADTGQIDLKPITLLVGANSSGKSSFLRVFPLLRQSTETRTRSGLLLNEPYVDYGLFPIAVRKNADPAEIVFDLGTSLFPALESARFDFLLDRIPVKCSIAFAQRHEDQRYSFVRRLALEMGSQAGGDTVGIEINEDGRISSLTVNDYDAHNEAPSLQIQAGRGLVPALVAVSDQEEGVGFVSEKTSRIAAFTHSLRQVTDPIFHGRTLEETRLKILRAMKFGPPKAMLEFMGRVTDNGSWNQAVRNWTTESLQFRKLRNLIIADRLSDILRALNYAVSQFALGVVYFEPIRARVQRDYVSRDIQVESVNPDGGNVAMFLASLSYSDRSSFQEWCEKNFGFSVHPVAAGDGARVALRLNEVNSGGAFNLADMGFGYSQMLPLLVQIWALTEERSPRRDIHSRFRRSSFWALSRRAINFGHLIAIEQPELHLHPALQAKIADLLISTVKVAQEHQVPIRFVVETHSQTIVNRLGHLIEAKRVRASDVQLLLFERGAPDKDPMISEVRKATFSDDGVLQNWPFGFFLPPLEDSDVIEPRSSGSPN